MDVDLDRYRAAPATLRAEPGCYTNWLGIRTDAALWPRYPDLPGSIIADVPIAGAHPSRPDDLVHASFHEYAALVWALEHTSTRESFSVVELGAGWGPWLAAAATICRRLEFKRVDLVGVEASKNRFDLMRAHLHRNGLLGAPDVHCRLLRGAVWSEDQPVQFPIVANPDHGAAAQADATASDYRGNPSAFEEVQGISIATACAGLTTVDYVHVDIQGSEGQVVPAAAALLNERVRNIFVATHSRSQEGRLLEFFLENQWDVRHEKPCTFVYDRGKPSIEGMIRFDGEIFATNPRLGGPR